MAGMVVRSWGLVALALLPFTACDGSAPLSQSQEPEGPQVSIVSPSDGAQIGGNVLTLELEVEGIEIVPPDGDTSGETGHFHVFVDRDPPAPGEVIPEDFDIVHSTETSVLIPGLSGGIHTFRVVLGDGTHSRIGSQMAEVTVTFNGPSIQVTAPPQVKASERFDIEVTAEEVHIAEPDAEEADEGPSGHLHVFIDPVLPPEAAGEPIPQSPDIIHTSEITISIDGLDAGDHTIWVVLGDDDHVPFDPPVMARVSVTAS